MQNNTPYSRSKIRNNYKVIIIGDSGVGKTSISQKYSNDAFFESEQHTIGVSYLTKLVKSKGPNEPDRKMCIWDTAGQERFFSIVKMYFKNCRGICCVYDVTDIQSLKNCEKWLDESAKHISATEEKIPIILLGNKYDRVSDSNSNLFGKKEQLIANEILIEEYERKYNITHFHCSAKTGYKIEEAFYYLLSCMLPNEPSDSELVTIAEDEEIMLDNMIHNMTKVKCSKCIIS